MIHRRRIKKTANSYAIIPSETLRDRIDLSEHSAVNLTPSANRKSLIPSTEKPKVGSEFFSLLESVSEEYKEALDALSR